MHVVMLLKCIVIAMHTLRDVQLHINPRKFLYAHVTQAGTHREPMCCETSSSTSAQQIHQIEAVVHSPHTNFYVLGWLSAAVPLLAVVFQLLFCVAE